MSKRYTKALKEKKLYALFLPLGSGSWMEGGDTLNCYGVKNLDTLEFKLRPMEITVVLSGQSKQLLVDMCSTVEYLSKTLPEQFGKKGRYDLVQNGVVLDSARTLLEQHQKGKELVVKKKKSKAINAFNKTISTLRDMTKKKEGFKFYVTGTVEQFSKKSVFTENLWLISLLSHIEQFCCEEPLWEELDSLNEETLRHIENEIHLNAEKPNLRILPPHGLCCYMMLRLKEFTPIISRENLIIWSACQSLIFNFVSCEFFCLKCETFLFKNIRHMKIIIYISISIQPVDSRFTLKAFLSISIVPGNMTITKISF